MAELVYAQDLKSWARKGLRVRVSPRPPCAQGLTQHHAGCWVPQTPPRLGVKSWTPQGVEVAERATELLQSRTAETGRAMLVSREATSSANQIWWCLFEKVRTHFAENPHE